MNKNIAKRLRVGDDLKKSIEHLCNEHQVHAGIVLCAVGSLSRARIRLAGASKNLELLEDLEIVSVTGTVNDLGSHLHVAVSDSSGGVYGGHLLEGCEVRTTAEVVVSALTDLTFRRQPDPETGFDELVISRGGLAQL